MKTKKILTSAIFLSLFLPIITWAASFSYTPMEQIPGFATDGNFYNYIGAVYKFGIWGVGISALLMITIGGYMYIASAANVASIDKAKAVITDAIVGLSLALISYLLLYVINPNLVRLSGGNIANVATQTAAPNTGQTSATCTNAAQDLTDICTGSCDRTCIPSTFLPYTSYINTYATANVPRKLIESIICHESSGNRIAESGAGACGLMQVMPDAGFTCATDPRNLFDPETNIRIGTKMFADKLAAVSSFNYTAVTNIEMAAASYNCCANRSNPNDLSADCKANNIPAWACPINPGANEISNMCTVKKYACDVALCAL
jgi:hypothetical protein